MIQPEQFKKKALVVLHLNAVKNNPLNILANIPAELHPVEGDSYEDNFLTDTVPVAFKDEDEVFKNAILANILRKESDASVQERYLIIALIKAGASPNICVMDSPDRWIYPISQIVYAQDAGYAQALLSRGAYPNRFGEASPIKSAHTVELARVLVDYGTKIKLPIRGSEEPLLNMIAEKSYYEPELLRFYSRLGLSVNAQSKYRKETPLHKAVDKALWGNAIALEKVKILLELNCNVHLHDCFNKTPIDYIDDELNDIRLTYHGRKHFKFVKDIIIKHEAYSNAKTFRNIALD